LLYSTWKIKTPLYLDSSQPVPASKPLQTVASNSNINNGKEVLNSQSATSTNGLSDINLKKTFIDTRNHDRMKWKLNQVFGEDPSSVNEGLQS
jgi:hypothetical protein